MVTLQNKFENDIVLKQQIEKLIEEKNNLINILSDNNEYETIFIKDTEYFLIRNEVYKIKKIKGDFYGTYDPDKNKITKIKN